MKSNFITMIVALTVIFIFSGGTAVTDNSNRIIFAFTGKDQFQQWMVINDGVMGGVSMGIFRQGDDSTAIFSGDLSLENNGGFSSVSSKPAKAVDLSEFSGIAIRCKGDGKRYKSTLKNDVSFGGFAYQFPFTTREGEWMVVKAPFDEFKAFFRGEKVADAPLVDRSNIKSFGFIIADKQAGQFALEIDWIKAYR